MIGSKTASGLLTGLVALAALAATAQADVLIDTMGMIGAQSYDDSNGNDTVLGNTGLNLAVELSAAGIVLPGGTWWIDIQPVDTAGNLDLYYQIRDPDLIDGFIPRALDGAQDHGNSYGGAYGSFDWVPMSQAGAGYADAGTYAFRVEGTAIPEPASVLLLALAALPLLRRRRGLRR